VCYICMYVCIDRATLLEWSLRLGFHNCQNSVCLRRRNIFFNCFYVLFFLDYFNTIKKIKKNYFDIFLNNCFLKKQFLTRSKKCFNLFIGYLIYYVFMYFLKVFFN